MTRWLLALTLACAVTPAWALFEDNEARRAIRAPFRIEAVAERLLNLYRQVADEKAAR